MVMELTHFTFDINEIFIDDPIMNMFKTETAEQNSILCDYFRKNTNNDSILSFTFHELIRMLILMKKCYFYSILGTYNECIDTIQNTFGSPFEKYNLNKDKVYYLIITVRGSKKLMMDEVGGVVEGILDITNYNESDLIYFIQSLHIDEKALSDDMMNVIFFFGEKVYI
jgi:hypothetical protein